MSRLTPLRRRMAKVATTALVLAAVACNRGDGNRAGGGTTVPTEPSTTPTVATTAETLPSYEIPEVIDAAYVEKVMKALDHVYGDAVRIMARDRQLTDEFLKHLLAIYTNKEFEIAQELWLRDLTEGLQDLREDPGDPTTRVQRLVRSSPDCIVAAVDRDFSATRTSEVVVTPQHYIGLIPKQAGFDVLQVNHTPWIMSFDGFIQSGAEPEKPCLLA